MKKRWSAGLLAVVAFVVVGAWGGAPAPDADGMILGAPQPTSLGAMTFGPDGTLFMGDAYAAKIIAVDLDDAREGPTVRLPEMEGLDRKISSLLGTTASEVRIHDMAVHPTTQNVFLTVSRGQGGHEFEGNKSARPSGGTPHLIRMIPSGELSEVELDGVRYSEFDVPNALAESERTRSGDTRRLWTVVELGFSEGQLYASGISNEEFSSTMLQIPFPFEEGAKSNAIRIFHTAHGRWETDAPARVFTPYMRDGETRIFAGFSCTPLVDFGFTEAEEGTLVEGKTVAELGAGNHVLDMITVEKDGHDYILLANHLHPFAMLSLGDVPEADKLTRPTNRAGIEREFMSHRGVVRLANLGPDRVVTLQRPDGRDGRVDLRTIEIDELPMG